MLVPGHYRSGAFARNIALFNLPGSPAFFRARANALFMIAMPATTALGSIVSGYILSLDGIFKIMDGSGYFPVGRISVSFVRHYGLVYGYPAKPEGRRKDKKCFAGR